MERLTRVERTGIAALAVIVAAALAAVAGTRSCAGHGGGDASDTTSAAVKEFIERTRQFEADTIVPAKKKNDNKKTGTPEPSNPLSKRLEKDG